ncbi:MAG: DUF58 domain-containing protein [bacterium]|nr:DUF58 domain-containing protein [bacterium]
MSVAFFLIASINQVKPIYYVSTCMLSLAAASCLYSYLVLKGVRVTRIPLEGGFFAGEEITLSARIRNETGRIIPRLMLRDQLPVLSGAPEALLIVDDLAPHETLDVDYQIVMARRGIYADDRLCIEAVDPLGILQMRHSALPAGSITVYPAPVSITIPAPSARYSRRIGDNLSRLAPEGRETFAGLRDYHQGDDLKRIHWRATAREGKLFVKEFERDAVPTAIILLDARSTCSSGFGLEAVLEDAVIAAISLAVSLLKGKIRLYFQINGDGNGAPVLVNRHYIYDILALLAALKGGQGKPLSEVLTRDILESEPGASVYIVSSDPDPLLADSMITASARKVFSFLISPDASTYGKKIRAGRRKRYIAVRQEQFSRLERAGLGPVDIKSGDDMAEALSRISKSTVQGSRV